MHVLSYVVNNRDRAIGPDLSAIGREMTVADLDVTPLVVDGVIYVTAPNQAFALDPLTGRPLWNFSRPRTPKPDRDGAKGTNRGVAVLGDKVFMVTDNAHLLALNRITGGLVRQEETPPKKRPARQKS